MIQLCDWIIVAVSVALFLSASALLVDSRDQTTPIGLPQWIYIVPAVAGSLLMIAFGTASAVNGPRKTRLDDSCCRPGASARRLGVEHSGPGASHHAGFPAGSGIRRKPDHRRADRICPGVRGAAVFPDRSIAADAGVFAADRVGPRSFCSAGHPVLRAGRSGHGGQRHVGATDRAAAADDGPSARRAEPDHDHRHRVLLRRVRFEAGRYRGGGRRSSCRPCAGPSRIRTMPPRFWPARR